MRRHWFASPRASVLALAFVACGACGAAPKPDDVPPPVEIKPPQISCPADVSVDTFLTSLPVTFAPPVATNGTPPVATTCSKSSGGTFGSGETIVSCTASDAIARQAQCSFTVRVTVVPQLRGTAFLAFGDSITDGETANPVPQFKGGDDAFPKVLEKLLKERYKLQTVSVVAFGIGGASSAVLREWLPELIVAQRPDALILFEGANDVNQSGNTGLENLRANLTEQIRGAFSRGVKIVFLSTILPQCPNRNFCSSTVANPGAVPDANRVIREVAAAQGAILVDNYAALLPQDTTFIGDDGLHPTKAGHQKIAEMFFDAIKNNFEVPAPASLQSPLRTTKTRPQT